MESLSLIFRAFICLLAPTSCHDQIQPPHAKQTALFVFGDSLFDPGNNNYIDCGTSNQANFYPYGTTFFKNATGRFSDGRVLPDFIAEFAQLPFSPAYLEPGLEDYTSGVNFASAGAGVLVETHPGTINLKMQLSYFLKVEKSLRQNLGDLEGKKLLMRAVYLFSIGGNDYIAMPNSLTTPAKRKEYIAMVIGNLTVVIKDIYEKGGRKFAFQNAGPLGCIPLMRSMANGTGGTCAKEPSMMAELHNIALSKVLGKMEQQLEGFTYSIFDYYTSLTKLMEFPEKNGLKEGKTACCGSGRYRGLPSCGGKRGIKNYDLCDNPSEHVWFDFAHTTESANWKLAQLMWSGTPSVAGPYNMKALFEML